MIWFASERHYFVGSVRIFKSSKGVKRVPNASFLALRKNLRKMHRTAIETIEISKIFAWVIDRGCIPAGIHGAYG